MKDLPYRGGGWHGLLTETIQDITTSLCYIHSGKQMNLASVVALRLRQPLQQSIIRAVHTEIRNFSLVRWRVI